MATPASSNFQFLSAHDTLLVALGAQAERYFVEDPVTSLMKLRQFGERLAQRAAAHLNVRSDHLKQYELVEKLASPPHNALSAEVRSLFHELRKVGNDAVHEFTASHEEALHLLKQARKLAIWFHSTFSRPTGGPTSSSSRPRAASGSMTCAVPATTPAPSPAGTRPRA